MDRSAQFFPYRREWKEKRNKKINKVTKKMETGINFIIVDEREICSHDNNKLFNGDMEIFFVFMNNNLSKQKFSKNLHVK